MVQTIFYYGFEFLTKVIVKLYFTIKDLLERRRVIKEKEKRKPTVYHGWVRQTDEAGNPIIQWHGLMPIRIPVSHVTPRIVNVTIAEKKPTRLFTRFDEAASKDFFKELEEIAKRSKSRS